MLLAKTIGISGLYEDIFLTYKENRTQVGKYQNYPLIQITNQCMCHQKLKMLQMTGCHFNQGYL